MRRGGGAGRKSADYFHTSRGNDRTRRQPKKIQIYVASMDLANIGSSNKLEFRVSKLGRDRPLGLIEFVSYVFHYQQKRKKT